MTLFFLLFHQPVTASSSPIRVDSLHGAVYFGNRVLLFADTTGNMRLRDLMNDSFSPASYTDTVKHNAKTFAAGNKIRGLWIYSEFVNSSGSEATVYFYNGKFRVSCYQFEAGSNKPVVTRVHDPVVNNAAGDFIYKLNFKPGSYTRAWFHITPGNAVTYEVIPMLAATSKDEIANSLISSELGNVTFNYWFIPVIILIGCILSMIIFSFVYLVQTREVVFLYYFFYLLFTGFYFFFRSMYYFSTDLFWFRIDPFRDVTWQAASYFFYFLFACSFANFRQIAPKLNILMRTIAMLVVVYIVADICFLVNADIVFRELLYRYFRFVMVGISVVCIAWAYTLRDRLSNYLATGSSLMVAGGAITIFLALFYPQSTYAILRYHMNFMQAGILGEIMLFTFGLSYKNKLREKEKAFVEHELKMEREMKEMERLQTVINTQESERKRVSRELHDDLGSGLSTIRFLSEVGKTRSDPSKEMDRISVLSNDLVDNMRQIIWTMSPENSSMHELISYIKKYADEYLENNNLQFRFSLEGNVPDKKLSGEERRSIFLVIKESLHNTVKHAEAQFVVISVSFNGTGTITITDDGKGFPEDNFRKSNAGNGLKNMKRRMEEINGTFETLNDRGAKTILTLP